MLRPTPSDEARPPRRWASALIILGYGISASTVAGIVEAAIRRFGLPWAERLPDVSNAFFWILPVGIALLNLPFMALAAAANRIWPTRVTVARGVMAGTVIPALSISLALATTRIAEPVHLLLALSVAALAGRAVANHPVGFRRLLLVAAPILMAIPPVTVAVVLVSRARAARALASAPAPGSPNVLLVVWDAVRRPNLSLYGYQRPTSPKLAARAAGGVVFERAYSTAPWTLPSHASMFTGFAMQDLNASWTAPLDRSRLVVSEVFSRAGYRTAGFTANLMATHRPTGLARGFQSYEDWRFGREVAEYVGQTFLSERLRKHQPFRRWLIFQGYWKHAEDVNHSFLRWLDRSPGDRPYFAFLNYFDAHWPYRSTRALRARFGAEAEQDRYDAAIAYLDTELDRLLGELDRRGLLANTIVLLTADHGEEFGEHGFLQHGESLYAQALSVPLVVIAPGRAPAGLRISRAVSTRHVGPTLVGLAGLDSAHGRLAGESLARFWSDATGAEDTVLVGVHQGINQQNENQITGGPATALIGQRYHYVRTGRGVEHLFDIDADPEEHRDLIGVDSLKPAVERTRHYLATRLGREWVPRVP
jgi:arylsulfatase A-like enzyme